MPQIEGPKIELTFEVLLTAVAVIAAAIALLVGITKGIEAWKKITLRDRVRVLEERADKVDKRLEQGNKRFRAQSDDMGQMLVTMQGLLMHFISGNDHKKLIETNEKLTAYMAERTTRDMEDDE